MFDTMNHLELVSAYMGNSSLSAQYKNRPSHALIYKINGESIYTFPNKSISQAKDEVLFLPQGTDYLVKRISRQSSKYIVVNFYADFEKPVPAKYQLSHFTDISHLFHQLDKLWTFQTPANRFKCLSLVYELIFCICSLEAAGYNTCGQRQLIAPAIDYLEEHIFDCHFKIDELHKLCSISDTYFRRLFVSQFGITPKKYVTNKRIAQAKNILAGGDYQYIYDVAKAVGYEDSLYFSQEFKKLTGISPVDYRTKRMFHGGAGDVT